MISVIIPSFNSCETIERSVLSALQQEDVEIEVIVVDDGSMDDTEEIVANIEDSRLQYVWQENAGPSVARNRGVDLASGDFVAFLDADDEWRPRKLVTQLRYMEQHNLLVCVTDVVERLIGGRTVLCAKPDVKDMESNEIITLIYHGKMTRNTPTLVVEKTLFERVGGFDAELKNREDHHLLCKLAANSKLGTMNQAMVCRHVMKTSYSQSYDPVDYYSDTLLFHKKMHSSFSFLNVARGVQGTKWLAFKKALRAGLLTSAISILLDREWREIVLVQG